MRAVVIGETLYGVCEQGVIAAPTDDLEPTTTIELTD
jgi:hypothetical protein